MPRVGRWNGHGHDGDIVVRWSGVRAEQRVIRGELRDAEGSRRTDFGAGSAHDGLCAEVGRIMVAREEVWWTRTRDGVAGQYVGGLLAGTGSAPGLMAVWDGDMQSMSMDDI